jgi:type II secretory pathway pseudopilin PulG
VTLVEALIAAAIVTVLALGALTYQYLGATHFRVAHAELTATRAGQLLIEDWKGSGAPDIVNYDASTLGMGFEKPDPSDNSYYTIAVDGIKMYVTLSYSDVDVDEIANIPLRQISAKLQWRKDFGSRPVEADDPSINLTTYPRKDRD